MKSILTLKNNSFLFSGSVNLTRGIPFVLDTELYANQELEKINNYIRAGIIHSSEGLLTLAEVIINKVVEPIKEAAETTEEKIEEAIEEVQQKAEEVVEATQEQIKKVTRQTKSQASK